MVMMNTVIQNIRKMNNEELNSLVREIKDRRTLLAKSTARGLRVGDVVSFDPRNDNTVTGRVTKINRKTVIVKDSNSNTNWKVTANLLTRLSIGEEV